MVETNVGRARERVRAERSAVAARRDAFASFADRVERIPASTGPPADGTAVAGTTARRGSADDRRREVRAAFAETVGSHEDDDGSVLDAVRARLGNGVAVALSPTTETPLTPPVKRAVLDRAEARRVETATVCRALGREAASLDDAERAVDEVTSWVAATDETPMSGLGFDALRRRHERLADHRERCSDLAAERQSFLRERTITNGEAGVRHRSLVPRLYEDFPSDHPVLATAARLDATCAECQRAVRRHLTRRA